jgi:hypothetical protein
MELLIAGLLSFLLITVPVGRGFAKECDHTLAVTSAERKYARFSY